MIFMNAKHSHCINSLAVSIAVVLLAGVQHPAGAQAFDKAKNLNFWNDGRNVTGLRTDSVTISYAEIYGAYKTGDFHDSYEASSAWRAGAVAKTIVHLPKFSMNGSFSFDQDRGKDMCGSMFIKPGYYPIDVMEFTPGTKILQTYSFSGGIASELNSRWRIGGKMDFESSNYAKRKDIRHTNYRLDMTVAPSLMYHNGDFDLGLSYVYNKTNETIDAEQIGTATASSYYAFLDKGLMYGTYEVWNGSGTHLAEAGVSLLPVKEISNGAAVQVQWRGLYADAEYLHSSGTVGERGYTWYEFPGEKATARLGFKFNGLSAIHLLRMKFAWQRQVNNEYAIEKVTENGITIPHLYGSNRIFERRILSLSPEYRMYGSKWEASAAFGYAYRQGLSSLMYPYKTLQDVTQYDGEASVLRHLHRFDIGLGATFFKGKMDEESASETTTSGVTSTLYRQTDYYNLQKEYMTAMRAGGRLSIRYNVIGGVLKGSYIEGSASILHGFKLDYISGAERYEAVFKAGYQF